jgi:hypothetical protein
MTKEIKFDTVWVVVNEMQSGLDRSRVWRATHMDTAFKLAVLAEPFGRKLRKIGNIHFQFLQNRIQVYMSINKRKRRCGNFRVQTTFLLENSF